MPTPWAQLEKQSFLIRPIGCVEIFRRVPAKLVSVQAGLIPYQSLPKWVKSRPVAWLVRRENAAQYVGLATLSSSSAAAAAQTIAHGNAKGIAHGAYLSRKRAPQTEYALDRRAHRAARAILVARFIRYGNLRLF